MLNIDLLMEELEEEARLYPQPDRLRQLQRVLDDHDPNVVIELSKAPEDIQVRIKELDNDKEEIWEWIHEEANLYNVKI
jgi:hypothetical protein|tara:strand:+ start:181 stop:417 length:237 start_codon:yes stop_codon:yes gene_type:complete